MEDPCTFEHELLSFTNDKVVLIAGQERQQFHVHRDILEQHSWYFYHALNGEWGESKNKEIMIENAEAHIVHRYLHFLFTGRIASKVAYFPADITTGVHEDGDASFGSMGIPNPPSDENVLPGLYNGLSPPANDTCQILEYFTLENFTKEDTVQDPTPDDIATTEYQVLAEMYCFGEFVQDERIQDAVIDAIMARVKQGGADYHYYPTTPIINTIYEGTPADSPARRLMVHIYSTQGISEWVADDINPEFLLELTRQFCGLNREHQSYVRLFAKEDSCEFHQHAAGERCRIESRVERKRKRKNSESVDDSDDSD
ncbi:hypothetical protein LTR78_002910 [Recurvomyces mirabilis]|uniref:BTB domain-containing protein n=1 Tax=Recurvomyces mirabilis TaxID=574656 RepID=A0AAE0WT87_9PEZI|nr:hypothetical protein LTR78_002910 [Recurvomyces mirabilis]KAK5159356.1 hypothetical protein LTS14_002498 [Recurvomyces mirabilis]